MKTIFKYIFLTAIRDKIFIGLIAAILAAFSVSGLIGYTSLLEELEMQTVVFASSARIIIIAGMILFICFYIQRLFETKEIQFILSKNISRIKFIFSFWISFNIISTILVLFAAMLILLFCSYNLAGFFYWLFGIFCELLIVSTFAILSSLIMKSSIIAILSNLGFYLISRLTGFFLDAVFLNFSNKTLDFFSSLSIALSQIISRIFPRLDLFSQTNLLIYGLDSKVNLFAIVLGQTLIYVLLMLFIASYDFRKKNF